MLTLFCMNVKILCYDVIPLYAACFVQEPKYITYLISRGGYRPCKSCGYHKIRLSNLHEIGEKLIGTFT